jgi:hypothetical protein
LQEKSRRFQGISIEIIKWIAGLTMIIDHVGIVCFHNTQVYPVFRGVGRLAFPLYCFMLVEGFFHTSSLRNYIKRIGIFAILSEIPFNLAITGSVLYPEYQNVMFTLLVGLLTMIGCEYYRKDGHWIYAAIMAWIGIFLADLVQADYGSFGVLLILIFYVCHDKWLARIALTALAFIWKAYWSSSWITGFGMLSVLFISLYKGNRGKKTLPWQVWYLVYPVHLLILGLIRVFW